MSLPTVAVGVVRFRARGAYRDGAMLAGLALPMATGSAAGATLGAAMLPLAPTDLLKRKRGEASTCSFA
jgi:uncharacterized protein